MKKYYLCMEIGGTNLRYGVIDEKFAVLDFTKTATKELSEAQDKGEYIKFLLKPAIEKYGLDNIICLSLSLASLMNKERTICYSSPNIRGFDNLALASVLESKTGLPVYMERDVNTALLYEIWKRNYDRSGIIIGIYIGTGLGNAMCIDGKVYRGSTGSSCELGHIPVAGCTEECGCGKKGCIELMASGKALANLSEQKYHCRISDIFKLHGEEEDVKKIISMCALATATEITILDPKYVILGGGVAEMQGFPLDYFTETVKANLRIPNPRISLNIALACPDAEAGIVGAALNASALRDHEMIQTNSKCN
jgi:allose kinase